MSKFYVLSLGEFISKEGIDITLESFADLYHDVTSKHQKQMQLTMITKGILTDHIQAKINSLSLNDAVQMILWSEQEKIEKCYRESSIMLIPSKENITKLVSEAFSYGLPVVCYENENLEEVVDSSCGMLVAYDVAQQNISIFAEVMRMLYFDSEARKMLKKGATRKYETQFSWGMT